MGYEHGVKYVSLYERSGYGVAAGRYLRALSGAGVALSWVPMVPGKRWGLGYEPYCGGEIADPVLGPLCNREINYDTVLVHTVPEYYPIWRSLEPGKRLIGYTTWETDRPPDHWPPLLNAMDLLLVPCEWNRDVFRAHGVTTPIAVIPHIAHPGPFAKKSAHDERIFYTIAPWTVRKAMGNVLEAFCRAFSAGERVKLVIKTSEQDFELPRSTRFLWGARSAARRVLRRHRGHAPVEIVTRWLADQEIDALHAAGDCYVSLGHGEGWSIPAFDAAAFGNPVIAPRFGGPLEYLSSDSAYLVDCKVAPVRHRREPRSYSGNQNWAVPDLEVAARVLRAIHERFDEARTRAAKLAAGIRERFSEKTILRTLLAVL